MTDNTTKPTPDTVPHYDYCPHCHADIGRKSNIRTRVVECRECGHEDFGGLPLSQWHAHIRARATGATP